MSQPMHDYVVKALAPLSQADLAELEEKTGVSKWTIQKIRIGQIKNPGIGNLQPLYDHLKKRRTA